MPRVARVSAKTENDAGDLSVHLETDDGVFRVAVEPHVWSQVQLNAQLQVPDGDLEHPAVSAGIKWTF